MQFFLRDLKNNSLPILLRLFAFGLMLGVVLAQVPALNAQAAGEPKLILEKTIEGGATTAKVGDIIRYRIRFECSSLVEPCGEVEITDDLQAGLTYLPPPNSSVPAEFEINEVPAGSGHIVITKKDNMLLDGSQYDAVIAVRVNYDLRPLPQDIDNELKGQILPPGETIWQIATPGSAPTITVSGLNPSWGLNKTLYSPTINPTVDTNVTYQIRLCPIGVSGNVPLQNIVIRDTLPENAIFISASDGGTISSGVVRWDIAGPVTPPACATRYVTMKFPKDDFPIGTEVINTVSAAADYEDSDGDFCDIDCFVIPNDDITHPIDDIFDVPSYDKNDVGDPVGMSGTARFVLSLNTNGTNYPANNVMLIDNLLPDAEQLEVTAVTSGRWSETFNYVRAYVEYSTNNGSSWIAFGGVANYNDNTTYTAPVTNITNVRWRFEYDPDRLAPYAYIPGLPYTWSFSTNPEIRVTPRAVDTTSSNGIPLLKAAANTTYTNCVQVSRETGDPLDPDAVLDACKYEGMTVRGDYVSLRTSKGETPGVPWDDIYDALITNPGFTADTSILPGDTLKYTITLDVTERSSEPLIDPTILDTLPSDLVFVRDGEVRYVDGVATTILVKGAGNDYTFSESGPNPGSGHTLKWEFDYQVDPKPLGSRYLQMDFYARIPRGQAPGSRTNNLYVTTDSTDVLCEITGAQSTDTANIDGDGTSAEAACKTTDPYIVERSAALRGEKWIRSVAAQNNQVVRYDTFLPDASCPSGGNTGLTGGGTNNFTRYPCISRAYPENSFINNQYVPPIPPAVIDQALDDFEFNLRIFNDGNVDMMKYVLYDILPYYGDKGSGGTLAELARNSEFRPLLRGPIQYISGPPGTGTFIIEYNLTTNPCRPEVFNEESGAIPTGCDNNWTTTWSSAARSYRIRLSSGVIRPSTSLFEVRFGVPMSIPADAPLVGSFNSDDPQSYEISWNSFAHVGSYTDVTSTVRDLLASEPRKVGITIPEVMSIGNRVWRDSDNSGTINEPDDANPGIAGVTINLYRDVDNDGLPDDLSEDSTFDSTEDRLATTITDSGGYYLFSNISYDAATPGNNRFIVGIPASNFDGPTPGPAGPLYTLRSSTGTPADAKFTTNPLDANQDKEDHGIDPALNQEVFSPTITLQPNTEVPNAGEPAPESDLSSNVRDGIPDARRGVNGEADSDSDLTVDFGFFGGNDVPFSIGNHLWYDDGSGSGILNNGFQDGSEVNVADARVELYRDGNEDGILPPSEMIRFDVTDANGFYLFDNLDAGQYYVLVHPGNFRNDLFDPDGTGAAYMEKAGVLAGWYSSQPTALSETGIDGDDNGENNNTPDVQGIRSSVIILERGVAEPTAESHLSGDMNITLGFNPTAGDGEFSRGRYDETDETSNLTVDFGFIPPMSLGNRLWIDDGAGTSANNNNGTMDSGEIGVSGARVELWRDTNGVPGLQRTAVDPDTADEPIRYVTTDAAGYYLFDFIQPSDGAVIEADDYLIHIPASNFAPGGALENYISSDDSKQATAPDDDTEDMDDNGVDDSTPISNGVTSPLIEMKYGDEPTSSEIDIPANTLENTTAYGADLRGLFGQTDSNSNLTMDFGFVSPMSLGNRIWRDSDNSGTINGADNSSPGIANVVVNLYAGVDADNDKIPDDLVNILATDTTDSNGYYLFANISSGNYIVGIPASNFAGASAPLYSLRSSTGTPPIATYTTPADANLDQADHGIDPVSAGEAVYSPIINLTVSEEPTAETDLSGDAADGPASRGISGEQDNNSDLTVDFGFYGAETPFSIGNQLWYDDGTGDGTVNDGIRDDDEPVVSGARVELYRDGNKDGILPPSEMIRFDVTDTNGFYLFDNLDQGWYYVLVHPGNFKDSYDPDGSGTKYTSAPGVLRGWYSSQVTADSETNVDNDDNGIDTEIPETSGVRSSVIKLVDGENEPASESPLSGNVLTDAGFNPTAGDGPGSIGRFGETDESSNLTIDFGFIPPMSLGNRVWIDDGAGTPANFDNGIMDSGEPGVGGVYVELWLGVPGSGQLLETQPTDTEGYYLFEHLQPADNYYIRIPASNFASGGALFNYLSSSVTDPADNMDDEDDNGIDSATPATTGITSPEIEMAYDSEPQTPANEKDISLDTATYGTGNVGTLGQTDLNSNLTMDFGFVAPMSLGNRVWHDSDNSGTINAADDASPGIANVVVNLYAGVDDDNDKIPDDLINILATDTTDSNGYYLFGNLPAGNYIVGIPASNFAASTDALYAQRSSTGTPANATYTTPADANLDRTDHGIDPTSAGNAVYSPIINLAVGGELTSETDLSANPADGPASRGVNGEQNNNSDLTVDFGFYGSDTPFSIGNQLWFDDGTGDGTVNDGFRHDNEPVVSGARVELYRDGNGDGILPPSEMIRFDVTDTNGFYLFDNLDPGKYYVLVHPGNFRDSYDPDGSGTKYTTAPGVLRGWYSSQVTSDSETNVDNDDNGIDTDFPETSGVFSSVILLVDGENEPTSESPLSGDILTDPGFNPTAGDGEFSRGRFGESDENSNLTIDFGFIPPMSLGNRVWIDDGAGETAFRAAFNNGIMDFSEAGRGSVRVELWRDTNATSGSLEVTGTTRDTLIRYTTTDSNGYYLFERLQPAGNYFIHIRASNFISGGALENYISSNDATQATPPTLEDAEDMDDTGIDNGNDPVTNGITSPKIDMAYGLEPQSSAPADEIDISLDTTLYGNGNVGLYPGQTDLNSNLTMDFGFVQLPRSLGNFLWLDTGDGNAANSAYINNGIFDTGELPVPDGVRVSLYNDSDNDGIPDDIHGTPADLTDDWAAWDLTSDGFYLFDNLPAGRYLIGVDGDNFDTGGLTGLLGYTTSAGNVDNASSNTDSRDNGIDRADPGVSASWPYGILSSTINLTAATPSGLPTGEAGSGETGSGVSNNPTAWDGTDSRGRYGETDEDSDLTIDFGFVQSYALGNRVWLDTDNDGILDAGEVGMDGVQVQLYRSSVALPTGTVLATTVTTDGGYYLFDNLTPGDYVVVLPADNFNNTGGTDTYTKLVGYWSTATYRNTIGAITETAAPDPDNDVDAFNPVSPAVSDENGLRQTDAGTFQNAVLSLPVTLGPTGDTEPTNDDDLQPVVGHGSQTDEHSNLTVDFGFYRTEIGNLVFEDLNINGTYDTGENVISGARVRLYQQNNTEVFIGPDGLPGTTDDSTNVLTDAGGNYRFSGLPVGDYIVKVATVPTTGMISTIDNGSTGMQDDNNNPDLNLNNNDNGVGNGIPSAAAPVISNSTNRLTTNPGSTGALGLNTVTQSTGTTTDNTVDFGFVKAYSLGNRVWFDTDNDGVLDAGEAGRNGVRVELYRDDGTTPGVYDPAGSTTPDTYLGFTTTVTNTSADGYYRFDNLFPGEYIVVLPVDNFTVGGTTDALVGAWSTGTTLNSVSGTILEGVTNDPDAPTEYDASAVPAASDENGASTFSANAISYVASPAITLGGELEPITDDDPAAASQTGEMPDNRSNRTVDFGFYKVEIGNLVFLDNDLSGHFNTGDTPMDDVVVKLFDANNHQILTGPDGILGTADDASGVDVTTGTNSWGAGEYFFGGLPQGTYVVKVETPAGMVSTVDTYNSTDTSTPDTHADDNDNGVGLLAGTITSSTTDPLVMVPGEFGVISATGTTSDHTLDFGFINSVAIGNRLWFDTGAGTPAFVNNGKLDTGEVGVPDGVRVELRKTSDNSLTAATITSTVAAKRGYYKFDSLQPGTYYILIPASEFALGKPLYGYVSSTSAGTDEITDETSDENGADPISPNSPAANGVRTQDYTLTPGTEVESEDQTNYPPGTLTDNSVNFTADFGFVQLVGIGNRLWYDDGAGGGTANNGKLDGGEIGVVDGVVVELYRQGDSIGTPFRTTTTASDSGAAGFYQFDNLNPGNYYVHIPASNFADDPDGTGPLSAGVLFGFHSSTDPATPVTSESADEETDENGIDVADLVLNGISSMIYDLQVNSEPSPETTDDDDTGYTGYLADANVNFTADFGFYNIVAIGNRVWLDTGTGAAANNGIFDNGAGELGVNGVTVQLWTDLNNNNNPFDAGEQVGADVTTTNDALGNAGHYVFDNLLAGTYVVHIPASNFDQSTDPLYGYYSSNNNGADESSDESVDENGIDQANPASTGITSTPFTLSANSEATTTDDGDDDIDPTPIYLGVLDDDDVNFTADFGFVRNYSLGNRVWHDIDKDGIRDDGTEPGIENVTVNLYVDSNNDGTPNDINTIGDTTDDILASKITDANGYYRFDDLVTDTYIVEVVPPAGYASTLDADDPDSDADDDDDNGVQLTNGNVRSDPVTLGPGEVEPENENNPATNPETLLGETPDNHSNRTVDFGFITADSLGNKRLTVTAMMDNGPTAGKDYTTLPKAAIGEILTYQVRLEVPSGLTLPLLSALDQLDTGLAFVSCDSINAPNLNTDLLGGFDSACDPDTNPTITPQTGGSSDARQITFSLGNVSNNTAGTQVLIITYRVIVLDILSNQDGVGGLNNSITWSWTGGSLPPEFASPVEIVEPELSIDKSAEPTNANYNAVITFTLAVEHTPQSNIEAFDVILNDIIPDGLTMNPASIQVTGSASKPGNFTHVFDSTTNTLTVNWSVFALDETGVITFDTVFVGPAPVVNAASVAWTSLPIDPMSDGKPEPLSPYNLFGTERWYDPLDSTGLNLYGVQDEVTINLPRRHKPKELPETGFAPNLVTHLPPMPAGFAYANTDIILEIPKLKQSLKIAGVPYDNEDRVWNLTWLNTEAGWLENTAFPTHAGNSALTAHTTLSNGQPGPFAKLDTLKYGDQVIVHLGGQKYIFEVHSSQLVKPGDVNSTLKHEELPWLTLLTCKSYNEKTGDYAYRTAVRAVLVKVVDE